MDDEHEQLDDELARLAHSLRRGDFMMACIELAEFALKLDRIIWFEERVLATDEHLRPAVLAMVRREHASLRRMVGLVANALDRADERRGLEVIGKLRSVLLLHAAKEETLTPLAQSHGSA